MDEIGEQWFFITGRLSETGRVPDFRYNIGKASIIHMLYYVVIFLLSTQPFLCTAKVAWRSLTAWEGVAVWPDAVQIISVFL